MLFSCFLQAVADWECLIFHLQIVDDLVDDAENDVGNFKGCHK